MRLQKPVGPRAQPRQRVLAALVRRLLRAFTRTRRLGPYRADLHRLDLDQRVREVGEW